MASSSHLFSSIKMNIEIERKFLLLNQEWLPLCTQKIYIRQGYISTDPDRTVRIRIWDQQGKLTIKSKNIGGIRSEHEYDIPLQDAQDMLDNLCFQPQIEKYRYLVPFGHHTWEIDTFLGLNTGLVIAEIELQNIDEVFVSPPWLGKEVTVDHRYSNSQLCLQPYKTWAKL